MNNEALTYVLEKAAIHMTWCIFRNDVQLGRNFRQVRYNRESTPANFLAYCELCLKQQLWEPCFRSNSYNFGQNRPTLHAPDRANLVTSFSAVSLRILEGLVFLPISRCDMVRSSASGRPSIRRAIFYLQFLGG